MTLQKSLFGGTNTETHSKAYREELHAREKDQIPNPNVNPGQYAPKGGRNPLLKVVEHEHGWTASAMLKGGKEFRVEGYSRKDAISNAIRAGEKMGVVFDPPPPEPEIGGLFKEHQHPRWHASDGNHKKGQFAPKAEHPSPIEQPEEEPPFQLQRPKKNRKVTLFDNNDKTKQTSLFDAGKKGDLPGQNLLFNTDAGDMHNPATQENRIRHSRIYAQFKEETERYLRNYTLYDVDRYGIGSALQPIVTGLAMHAMSNYATKHAQGQQSPRPRANQPKLNDVIQNAMNKHLQKKQSQGTPSSGGGKFDEKLHPRETVNAGNHKPGQFTKKPGGNQQQQQKPVRPLTDPALKQQTHAGQAQPPVQPPKDAMTARVAAQWDGTTPAPDWKSRIRAQIDEFDNKQAGIKPHTPVANPHANAYALDPRRGTPEQKAADLEARKARDAGESKRNYPDNLNKPADQQTLYSPPEHPLDALVREAVQKHVGKGPAQPNPRKKTLEDGSPNPAFKEWMPVPKEKPSLLDRPVADTSGNPLENKAWKPPAEPATLLDQPVADTSGDPLRNKAWEQKQVESIKHDPTDAEVKSLIDDPYYDDPVQPPEEQPSIKELMRNPAWEARKAKEALEKLIDFDPAKLEQKQAEEPTISQPARLQDGDYSQLDQDRKKRSNEKRAYREWKKKTQENPKENIQSVASDHEIDHEPFSQYIQQMQDFEQGHWKDRERVKTAIRKAWGVHAGDLRKKADSDHTSLANTDNLKGNIPDADLFAHLGNDEHEWSQNAWEMLREDSTDKPGAHNREWVEKHAEEYKKHHMQHANSGGDSYDYEPEDGMPFSRKALIREVDRYFAESRAKHRQLRQAAAWTTLDEWL